jgi:hypothetical protein
LSNFVISCLSVHHISYTFIYSYGFFFVDKNQYVHRRSSISLGTLSSHEIQERIKVGLIRESSVGQSEGFDDRSESIDHDGWKRTLHDSDDEFDDFNNSYDDDADDHRSCWEQWEDLTTPSKSTSSIRNHKDNENEEGDKNDIIGLTLEEINSQKLDSTRRPSIDLHSIHKHDSETLTIADLSTSSSSLLDVLVAPERRRNKTNNDDYHKRIRRTATTKEIPMFESISEMSDEA